MDLNSTYFNLMHLSNCMNFTCMRPARLCTSNPHKTMKKKRRNPQRDEGFGTATTPKPQRAAIPIDDDNPTRRFKNNIFLMQKRMTGYESRPNSMKIPLKSRKFD